MIYGEIKEIKIYKGLSKKLDKVIDFILEKKYLNNKIGKNQIEGDNIYFNCDIGITRDRANLELEYHKRYIDIHIVIEGEEKIAYAPKEKCVENKNYNEDTDCMFVEGKIDTEFYLNPDKFLILFPEEPHLAMLKVEEEKKIKKLVFKVELK
ncbi:MAG: YhcH/YjgK/YiaL family protein [Fusobacterium sp.]|nr:YhcH/YjgK/YiaL family protein [Fusobacterium sp.]